MLCASVQAVLSAGCKPSHYRPLYFLRTMGPCKFDIETMSFAGDPVEQARCLMRGMDETRNLAPTLERLPDALAGRVGKTTGLPSREVLSGYLSKHGHEWDFAAYLWQPLAHARDNDRDAPMAKYFVIHDTSGPTYGHGFPDDINTNPRINNLQSFVCSDEWGKAHVVINRMGDMLLDHELSTPWRETKFEQAAEFGGALKGLFLHTELIQPRRRGARGDGHSPDPAFTPAQYDRLALLYVIESVRAERWLIPTFHAALDADIRNGHDDPLNFSVDTFAENIDRIVEKLQEPEETRPEPVAAATDAQPETPPQPPIAGWVDAQWDNRLKRLAAAKPAGPPAADGQTNPTEMTGTVGVFDSVPNSIPMPPAKPAAMAKLAPPDAIVAPEKSASPRGQKSASAEKCQTRLVKGHRRRLCEPDRAEGREHGKHAVRSADRDDSHEGRGARRHEGDAHARHERDSSRHHRA